MGKLRVEGGTSKVESGKVRLLAFFRAKPFPFGFTRVAWLTHIGLPDRFWFVGIVIVFVGLKSGDSIQVRCLRRKLRAERVTATGSVNLMRELAKR